MTSFREKRTKGSNDDFIIEGIYKTSVEEQRLYKEFCYRPGEEFQVYIRRDTLRAIYEHVLEGLRERREVAGVLIGKFLSDNEKNVEYVEIVHALSVQAGDSSNIDVSIPAQEWARIFEHVKTSAKYRGEYTIIGWYHSHPNMKAFMSPVDQNTQAKHFSNKGQVAIVVGLGMGIQEVKCFDFTSTECPLYFLPEENDTHLVVASLDKVQGMVKKEIYNGYKTIQELILEVQKLRAELEDLKNERKQTSENESRNHSNVKIDASSKLIAHDDENIQQDGDLTDQSEVISRQDSMLNNRTVINHNQGHDINIEPDLNIDNEQVRNDVGLEFQNIDFWISKFDYIMSDFDKEEWIIDHIGEDNMRWFYPELDLGIGFHHGEPDVRQRNLNLRKKIRLLSIDVSEISNKKVVTCIEEFRKILSDSRRKQRWITTIIGDDVNRKIIRATEKCAKLQYKYSGDIDTLSNGE